MNSSISPVSGIKSIFKHRGLIISLTKREVIGRYRGSFLGILWSFFNPMLLLTVYTFVFSVVFKARWGTSEGTKTEFALILFAGLIVFNLFAECINRAPGLIISNVNYVKKVVFPLEVLPIVGLASALFHALISTVVWLIVYSIFYGLPHLTILFFPVIILPLMLLILGISWALASLGVYLRDVSQIVGLLTTVLMFLSPIFYPLSALPEQIQPVLRYSPLAAAIEQARGVLYWGQAPSAKSLLILLVLSSLIAWIGFAWFQKTRKGFADVI